MFMRNKTIKSLLLLSLFTFLGFTACMQTRQTAGSHNFPFQEERFKELKFDDRNLGYMHLHRNDSFPTLFFLHGSPSDMTVYNTYYQDTSLAGWANIIAADRPGYGLSDAGKSEVSVRRQARAMWKILEKEGFPSPLYIIGSSYGGTVAAKMAMQKPGKVDGVVLVSASLAPGLETTYDISYLIRHRFFRRILPPKIMVANDEKLSHYESLAEMLPLWPEIKAPVIMFQGTRDRLILPENVKFARERLINSPYVEYHMLENERHFLQIKYKDLILERLRLLAGKKQRSKGNMAEYNE
jgi:pimeloyl-ACP methyl ester carboxylesterase